AFQMKIHVTRGFLHILCIRLFQNLMLLWIALSCLSRIYRVVVENSGARGAWFWEQSNSSNYFKHQLTFTSWCHCVDYSTLTGLSPPLCRPRCLKLPDDKDTPSIDFIKSMVKLI
ncbi:hypothetical protein M8C21_018268, partial [Ambrosia artemisiifolia]